MSRNHICSRPGFRRCPTSTLPHTSRRRSWHVGYITTSCATAAIDGSGPLHARLGPTGPRSCPCLPQCQPLRDNQGLCLQFTGPGVTDQQCTAAMYIICPAFQARAHRRDSRRSCLNLRRCIPEPASRAPHGSPR